MELSEVRSFGDRMVLKLRLGCDTTAHKQTKNNVNTDDHHHNKQKDLNIKNNVPASVRQNDETHLLVT